MQKHVRCALLVVLTFSGSALREQGSEGCAALKWDPLPAADKAYIDALYLARTLTDHGISVSCIAPSKMVGMFDGQQGAAVYDTSAGRFEALFAAPWESFDGLQITEQRLNGRYLYSFAGRPKARPGQGLNSARPVDFIKHAHRLLIVFGDTALAGQLRAALGL
jgi:hypothetical protein